MPKTFPGKEFYPKFRIASYHDTFLAKISLVTVLVLFLYKANVKSKMHVCNFKEVEQKF